MRVLRTLQPLTKSGWYHKAERSRAIQALSNRKHGDERLILSHGSKMRWRLKSYAASAQTDTVEGTKTRGRVTRNERKAMVEKFVREYREMNSGKFPTPSDAKKEVGGSYYFVRELVQELKYKCSISSMDNTDRGIRDVSQQELPRVNASSIPKVGSSQSKSKGHHLKHDKSKSVGTQPCRLNDETEGSLASEKNASPKTVCEAPSPSQALQSKSTLEGSHAPEVYERDSHQSQHEEVAQPQSKSSIWQSLKSFANGILGMWKGS